MKITLRRKLYIYLRMKFCKLTKRSYFDNYTVIYKYKNKISYFNHGVGISKKDAINKVRTIIKYSDFLNGVNEKDIEIIAIKEEV
jgi:hypothetical protein